MCFHVVAVVLEKKIGDFLMYSHAVAAAHSQVPLEKIEDKGVGHQ